MRLLPSAVERSEYREMRLSLAIQTACYASALVGLGFFLGAASALTLLL